MGADGHNVLGLLYCAKAALPHLLEASEEGPRGAADPGAVDTELPTHNRPEIREGLQQRFTEMERLEAEDIADAIIYIVTRPRRVAINEILIRPTEQQQ